MVQDVKQSTNNVQVNEMFPEIKMTQTNVDNEVNQVVAGKVDEMSKEVKMHQEDGPYEQMNNNVGWLVKDIFWEKKVIRAQKGGNQVLVTCYYNFCPYKNIHYILSFLCENVL